VAEDIGFTYSWRDAAIRLLIFAALTLLGEALNMLAPFPVIALPAGYGLALLYRRQESALPLALGGAAIAGLGAALVRQPPDAVDMLWPMLSGFITTLTLMLAGWWSYRKSRGLASPLSSYQAFLWFLGALTLGCLVAVLPELAMSPQHLAELNPPVLNLWLASFLGALATAVPTLAHEGYTPTRQAANRSGEAVLWLLTLLFALAMIWHQPLQALFILLPLMTWAATRFSLTDAMSGISVAGLGGLLAVVVGVTSDSNPDTVILAQSLITMMVAISCYIRILLRDRERIENGLEDIVEQRTRELQLTNYELKDEIFVRQQAEKSFRRSSQHFRALFETASNPIIVVDGDIVIRQWNSAAEMLFGYSRDEALGRNLSTAFIPPEQRDELAWKILKLLKSDLGRDSLETEIHGYDGSRHHVLWNLSRLTEDEDPGRHRLIMVGQDITEIRKTQAQLHYLAHYDALTDTANRRLFEDRCRQAITSALRYGHQCAVIGLDVDHFKRINDTLGHDAGDQLLQELASRITRCVREEDTVARLGGDEFAVMLARVSGAEGCEKVARNILEEMTRPIQVPGGELVITSSIGITLAPADGRDYDQLMKNADMAMYRAKKAGRNNIQFFSAEMNEEIQRQQVLEQELREALELGQLDLYYQPVFDARNGQIQGVEALLRWRHPQRGLLGPADFLDVAEQSGQLQALGEWVCLNACLQAKAIQAMSGSPVAIRINLSSSQYNHPRLAGQLSRVIRETRLDPTLLLIEIDEKNLTHHLDEAGKTLRQLKKLGVGLVLDRFGSGLSSLRLLRDLPFDQVKIDQDLLQHAPYDESAGAIVHTLINLARQLSLTVAASGVETPEQDAFLRSAGCHQLQGHRFSPAVPSQELSELFRRANAGEILLPEIPFNFSFHNPPTKPGS